MITERVDFSIQEAGCLIYAADKKLGGYPFSQFHEFFGGKEGLKDLTLSGAVMAMSLYQDDGYNVRVVLGDLTEEERTEWTSKVSCELNLSSGKMVVSGVCDEDFDDELSGFSEAETGGEYYSGCLVEIPEGKYEVSIYSYPPNDLAGGWMRIEKPDLFRACFNKNSELKYEKPIDYFARTRPDEKPPEWIRDGYEEASFLDFLIHLTPSSHGPETLEFESDGCIVWEYRKPYICPIGIRI